MEVMQTTQFEGTLQIKNLTMKTGISKASLTDSIKEIKKRISDNEYTIKQINTPFKENVNSKNFLIQSIQ